VIARQGFGRGYVCRYVTGAEHQDQQGKEDFVQWSTVALNKNSPIPLYYQLVEPIRGRSQSGELRSGDQLLSERDLSEQVAISRMTVRQAVAYLVHEGMLVVKQA
jgi:hypothetical protein